MKHSILLIGAGKETATLIPILSRIVSLEIVALLAIGKLDEQITHLCQQLGVPVIRDFKTLLNKQVDFAFVCVDTIPAEFSATIAHLHIKKLLSYAETKLLYNVFNPFYQAFVELEDQKETYLSAINATTEGIQILDEHGIIKYINPAFSKITGVHPDARIGKEISEISPTGAGAKVIQTGLPVKGVCNLVSGSSTKVISNGAPLLINGKMRGAVVLFQDITDIQRLYEELQKSKLKIATLTKELGYTDPVYSFSDLIGNNAKLLEAINIAQHGAENDSTILITGESGTGKEIFAQSIHHASAHWKKPFIAVNCASIPDALVESELFGHDKGAFTGAHQTKIGKFSLANEGTIFLDEIGDFPINVQAKLLRVLQEKKFERVGSNQCLECSAKIIAATNRDLSDMVKKGQFRADLYYRLQVIQIVLPPLRKRKEDIPLLTEHLMRKIALKYNKPLPILDKESLQLLMDYSWPGNVRELENILTRAVTFNHSGYLTKSDFQFLCNHSEILETTTDKDVPRLEEMEARIIMRALHVYGFSTIGKRAASKALNISLATLYNKIKLYNLT